MNDTEYDKCMKKELYEKKEFRYWQRINGYDHMIKNITAWIKYVLLCYNQDEYEKFYEKRNQEFEEKIKKLAKKIFEKIYRPTGKEWSFWVEPEFYKWVEDNKLQKGGKNAQCKYCGCTANQLKRFYCLVDSYRYTRGQNFEIDRKYGYIKTCLSDNNALKSFFKCAKNAIKELDIESVLTNNLKEALGDSKKALDDSYEHYISLPAPYNYDNCVVACAWCNNAKTDAFTNEEFEKIGIAIGEVIKSVVK